MDRNFLYAWLSVPPVGLFPAPSVSRRFSVVGRSALRLLVIVLQQTYLYKLLLCIKRRKEISLLFVVYKLVSEVLQIVHGGQHCQCFKIKRTLQRWDMHDTS